MAATRTIVLEVGPADLVVLRDSGMRLILAKPAGRALPNVAWVAVEPRPRMTISWDASYGVYVSRTALADRAALDVLHYVEPALDRTTYAFVGTEFLEPVPAPKLPQRHYNVRNAAPFAATFGLLQSGMVDGEAFRSPLNAVVLPPGIIADFTSETKVYMWTQPGITSGTVVPEAPVTASVIDLNRDGRAVRYAYRYDGETRGFVPLG